jgi:hypothetical protein
VGLGSHGYGKSPNNSPSKRVGSGGKRVRPREEQKGSHQSSPVVQVVLHLPTNLLPECLS